MIPAFTELGFLPPGLHLAHWDEFLARYSFSERRKNFIHGLHQILTLLRWAKCSEVRMGGSFVTSKVLPNDFDGVWMVERVDRDKLPMELDYSLVESSQHLMFAGCTGTVLFTQHPIFGGVLLPSDHWLTDIGAMVDNLHVNHRHNHLPVGVVSLNPQEVPPAEPWPRYQHFFPS